MERIPLKYNDQFHPTGPLFLKNEKIFKNTFLKVPHRRIQNAVKNLSGTFLEK